MGNVTPCLLPCLSLLCKWRTSLLPIAPGWEKSRKQSAQAVWKLQSNLKNSGVSLRTDWLVRHYKGLWASESVRTGTFRGFPDHTLCAPSPSSSDAHSFPPILQTGKLRLRNVKGWGSSKADIGAHVPNTPNCGVTLSPSCHCHFVVTSFQKGRVGLQGRKVRGSPPQRWRGKSRQGWDLLSCTVAHYTPCPPPAAAPLLALAASLSPHETESPVGRT